MGAAENRRKGTGFRALGLCSSPALSSFVTMGKPLPALTLVPGEEVSGSRGGAG